VLKTLTGGFRPLSETWRPARHELSPDGKREAGPPGRTIPLDDLQVSFQATSGMMGDIMRPMSHLLAVTCIATLAGVSPPPLHAQSAAPVNRLIERLQQGRPVIGTFTRTARPDLDFAVIDEQYGDFDIAAVREAVAAIRAGGGAPVTTPVVRIPLAARDAPQAVVKQVLDAGVSGVMFPDIETRAQAIAAVSSLGVGRAAGAGVWPLDPAGTLVAILQIETLAGIEHLEEILEVPGIGVIFLGPTDLAASAGEDGPNAPRVDALVHQVLEVCIERNIPCGYPIVARTREDAERETTRRIREGFTVLAVMTTAR
jgi:2-keto-3-deoxy-L-rhamnonate aldolase RhmA